MNRILLFLFCGVFLLCGCGQSKVFLPDGSAVQIEIADTPKKAERGLMFRETLDEQKGMLFVFEKDDFRLFWMKNTLIDLDMVFIDSNGVITSIASQVPHSYLGAPEEEITQVPGWGKYVLEIKGGTAQKHNLKQGDSLKLIIK